LWFGIQKIVAKKTTQDLTNGIFPIIIVVKMNYKKNVDGKTTGETMKKKRAKSYIVQGREERIVPIEAQIHAKYGCNIDPEVAEILEEDIRRGFPPGCSRTMPAITGV
jgi:hypothetical protein